MSINAGSNATFASFPKLLNVSFSLHAQTPTVKIPRPKSYKKIWVLTQLMCVI